MKTQNVIILGGSGIGMVAASILDRIGGHRLVGFLNDVVPVGTMIGKFRQFPVLGRSEEVHELARKHDAKLFVGYVGMTREKETADKIEAFGIDQERLLTIVDPSAIIPHAYCDIGPGCLICPLAQLSSDTKLGRNVMLLANSFVGHDTVLEDYVSVANNACIGANVRVGYACHIGTNASIREKINIGRHSLVGLGSVVLQDVPNDCIVAGNPCRIIRSKQA